MTASARDKFDKAMARFQEAVARKKDFARAWYRGVFEKKYLASTFPQVFINYEYLLV